MTKPIYELSISFISENEADLEFTLPPSIQALVTDREIIKRCSEHYEWFDDCNACGPNSTWGIKESK